MEVTYRVLYADAWRETGYINMYHPYRYKTLLWLLLFCVVVVTPNLLIHAYLAACWAILWEVGFVSLITFISAVYAVHKKLPSKSTKRFRTDKIGTQGFECLVPEAHYCTAWQDVLKIAETAQDLFVFAKRGPSYAVPKRAFHNPEQAQAFLQATKTYWNNAKSGLPLSDQQGVWPPAPTAGNSVEPGDRPKC